MSKYVGVALPVLLVRILLLRLALANTLACVLLLLAERIKNTASLWLVEAGLLALWLLIELLLKRRLQWIGL